MVCYSNRVDENDQRDARPSRPAKNTVRYGPICRGWKEVKAMRAYPPSPSVHSTYKHGMNTHSSMSDVEIWVTSVIFCALLILPLNSYSSEIAKIKPAQGTFEDRVAMLHTCGPRSQIHFPLERWTIYLALFFEGLLGVTYMPFPFEDLVIRLRTANQSLYDSVAAVSDCISGERDVG
jgi:hypothetical protein